MTGPGTGTGPHRVAGIDAVPDGRCPKCTSKKVLGPRVVKDDEQWCNCYRCGHAWQTNKPSVRKGGKSWSPKMAKEQ